MSFKSTLQVSLGITAGAVILIGVPVGIWAINTGTSGIRGAAQVTRQNNGGINQIAANSTWTKSNADVLRDHDNIGTVQDGIKAGTAYPSMLTDAVSACKNDVEQFNALNDDVTIKDWRPSDIPVSYNTDTECSIN